MPAAVKPKGINRKILEIQQSIKVEKSGEHPKYGAFMRDEDVVAAVRQELNAKGIIVTTRNRRGVHNAETDVGGRYTPNVFIELSYVFIDVETGEELVFESFGEAKSVGDDVSSRKAATQARKIAFLQLFQIGEVNDQYDSDSAEAAVPDAEPAPAQKSEEEKVKAGNLKEVVTAINAIVNDKENPIDGARVNLEGQAIAGEDVTQPQWRKDLFVMTKLLEKLNKIMMDGEVS